jgi:hypothetical protein
MADGPDYPLLISLTALLISVTHATRSSRAQFEPAQNLAPPRLIGARPFGNFPESAAAADAQPLRIQLADVDAGRRHCGIRR